MSTPEVIKTTSTALRGGFNRKGIMMAVGAIAIFASIGAIFAQMNMNKAAEEQVQTKKDELSKVETEPEKQEQKAKDAVTLAEAQRVEAQKEKEAADKLAAEEAARLAALEAMKPKGPVRPDYGISNPGQQRALAAPPGSPGAVPAAFGDAPAAQSSENKLTAPETIRASEMLKISGRSSDSAEGVGNAGLNGDGSSSFEQPVTTNPNAMLVEALRKAGSQPAPVVAQAATSASQSSSNFLANASATTNSSVLQKTNRIAGSVVLKGTVIPAVLTTAINSDLAGDCDALVTENVYDSVKGFSLLIPKGSKLNCVYNSEVLPGQTRIGLAFTRLIFPNGDFVNLGAMNGIDPQGRTGTEGKVNNHFLKQFGMGLLVAWISWATAPKPDVVNAPNGGDVSFRTDAGQILKGIADRVGERYKNLPPTIEVPIGKKLQIRVNQDISLTPYRG